MQRLHSALVVISLTAGCGSVDGGGGPGNPYTGDPAAPAIRSTFDSDVEGWTLQGFNTDKPDYAVDAKLTAPALFDAAGGDPGGACERHETFYGYTDYFAAPAKFLGDRAAYQGGGLRFELRRSDPPSAYAAPLIILQGGGAGFLYSGGHDAAATWSAYTVPLDAGAGWTHLDGTTPATADELHFALAELTAIWIRGEFVNGVDDGWLDDVTLAPRSQ
ncbi:MAG TPA: laminin B domain-containing protein [Polyangia bacterium]|nr:laminin B domain-containing protein [Polyangia bacterium]